MGYEFAGADGASSFDQAVAGGGTGTLALVSHAVKASLRLGINASPEPFTNIVASVGEDFAVAGVTALALQQPEIAAAIAIVLLGRGQRRSSSSSGRGSGGHGRWSRALRPRPGAVAGAQLKRGA